jgi:hypothetical protein
MNLAIPNVDFLLARKLNVSKQSLLRLAPELPPPGKPGKPSA